MQVAPLAQTCCNTYSFRIYTFHVCFGVMCFNFFNFSSIVLPLYGIIAVAVGGLVIIFITFMIILLVVLCVRHSRKKGK